MLKNYTPNLILVNIKISIIKNFFEIIETIKREKRLENDIEVADLLGIKRKTLATAKIRNSIPFEVLTSFCSKEKISLNWLLAGEGSKYQEEKMMSGMINEQPAAYSEETLDELVEMVRKIYKEGDFSEKAMVRGMIDEIHDKMIEKIEARLKAAAMETKSEFKKTS